MASSLSYHNQVDIDGTPTTITVNAISEFIDVIGKFEYKISVTVATPNTMDKKEVSADLSPDAVSLLCDLLAEAEMTEQGPIISGWDVSKLNTDDEWMAFEDMDRLYVELVKAGMIKSATTSMPCTHSMVVSCCGHSIHPMRIVGGYLITPVAESVCAAMDSIAHFESIVETFIPA